MGDIVEHVAGALADRFKAVVSSGAEMPFANTGVSLPKASFDGYARAAVRATLEYLRENVTSKMTRADPGTSTTDTHAFYEAKFRAMISAALNDIEGGTG